MDALLKLLFDNLFLLFALALIWNAVGVAFMLWRRERRGLVLPKLGDTNVVFSERYASGSSDKSWMTRLGGASNCLTVIVTRTHLAITTFFPFTAFAGIYDWEHLVPLSDITSLATKGRVTEVEFRRNDGGRRKVTLRMRNATGFLQALKGQTNSDQGVAPQPAARSYSDFPPPLPPSP